jgi:hypothetical protein
MREDIPMKSWEHPWWLMETRGRGEWEKGYNSAVKDVATMLEFEYIDKQHATEPIIYWYEGKFPFVERAPYKHPGYIGRISFVKEGKEEEFGHFRTERDIEIVVRYKDIVVYMLREDPEPPGVHPQFLFKVGNYYKSTVGYPVKYLGPDNDDFGYFETMDGTKCSIRYEFVAKANGGK